MGFDERIKDETEYIDNWLKSNNWTRNPVGKLPDLTKPDGTHQDIKFMTYGTRGYYNLVAQKHSDRGSEIDDWKADEILDICEFKFICPDDKIYIISCKDFMDNVHKEYGERLPTQEYSGTSFYLVEQDKLLWMLSGIEKYKDKKYNIYVLNEKNKKIDEWM